MALEERGVLEVFFFGLVGEDKDGFGLVEIIGNHIRFACLNCVAGTIPPCSLPATSSCQPPDCTRVK